jgi:hypothetical protein
MIKKAKGERICNKLFAFKCFQIETKEEDEICSFVCDASDCNGQSKWMRKSPISIRLKWN